jgi:hypothetical protein
VIPACQSPIKIFKIRGALSPGVGNKLAKRRSGQHEDACSSPVIHDER